jgi:hypothetical protein
VRDRRAPLFDSDQFKPNFARGQHTPAVVGFAIGTLTRAVIQFGFGLFFGRRRMQKEISKLRGDFIFCGVGRRVALEIATRNLPLVIVAQDPSEA